MSDTRPTLNDVAERSGYALRTVKKVMSGAPNVRERTRETVLRAAEDLHYTRNRAASALARRQQVKLAVVYSRTTDACFRAENQGFQGCFQSLVDLGLRLEYHETDRWEAQATLLDALRTRDDVQGVVLQPDSASQLDGAINALTSAGKPVVTFGADAPESRRLCYVGPDAYRAGRIGGQILTSMLCRRGQVLMLYRDLDHMQTRARRSGFCDRLAEHNPELVTSELRLPADPARAYETLRRRLEAEQVAGIFCTDADAAAVGRVLRDLGQRDVALVGFDLSEHDVALMHEGYLRVLIEQKPEVFSDRAATLLFRYLTERHLPEPVNITPMYLVTSECVVS